MDAQEIIQFIANAKKKTPVKVYLDTQEDLVFPNSEKFGNVVFGDWADIEPVLAKNAEVINDYVVENDMRNSAVPLLDLKGINARIEPGAMIRDQVEIGDNAVIMMGAIINIGARIGEGTMIDMGAVLGGRAIVGKHCHIGAGTVLAGVVEPASATINIGARIGEGTMIDMGAVLGGRAIVGKHCHIGAGTVLAGVVEPASATPVIVEDNVMIGANAVVIEGVHVGENAVVAAGAIVIEDVPANSVVAGCPAKVIKMKDEKASAKTELIDALRTI